MVISGEHPLLWRILSGLIWGASNILLGMAGGIWLSLAFGALLLAGVGELWHLARRSAHRLQVQVPAATGLGLLALITIATWRADSMGQVRAAEPCFGLFLSALLSAAALGEVIRGQTRGAAAGAALTVLAGVYIAFPMAYMIMLRSLPGQGGLFYFFLLLAVTWANDTMAYFVGSAFGRHRLAPLISPKKSVEGSVAGLAASVMAAAFYALAWGRSPWPYAGVGLVVGLLGQAGDLFESLLKRDFGVKDSGTFLPGHGGVLDRLDSLIFAAPTLYYLAAHVVG